ncbi:MAG: hypothetical protein LBN38_04535 [Verrucomicrobiota bacterium]|jgi:hypothetical protein|nr:hypothetical protein [Verrucomicrobiota bacterium]
MATSKRTLTVLIGCLAVYLLYAMLTGGAVIASHADFGGQHQMELAEGLAGDVALDSDVVAVGLPFIGFYHYSKPPFPIRIQLWDYSAQFTRIQINEITVDYDDGQQEIFNETWSRYLTPYDQIHSTPNGLVRSRMMRLSENTRPIVSRDSSCRITLRGFLWDNTGRTLPLHLKERFEYHNRRELSTHWKKGPVI